MKKTVRILLMEPKPLILDLTKKAILSKPDPDYYFQVIGTASTAKAGYFELYKHRPHILFLDPDLPDEEGASFIGHALERLPHLKIIGLSTMFREQAMLESGAHAFIPVPIQKTQIWRKLDELVEELDEMGLLEPGGYQEDPAQQDTSGLFEFEDPSENPEFTPIFEDLFKKQEDKPESDPESHSDAAGNPVVDDEETVVVSLESEEPSHTGENAVVVLDEVVKTEDKPLPSPEGKNPAGPDMILVDDPEKDPEAEDTPEVKTGSESAKEPESEQTSAETHLIETEEPMVLDLHVPGKPEDGPPPVVEETAPSVSGDGDTESREELKPSLSFFTFETEEAAGEDESTGKKTSKSAEPATEHPESPFLFSVGAEPDEKPEGEEKTSKLVPPSLFFFDTEDAEKPEETPNETQRRPRSPEPTSPRLPRETPGSGRVGEKSGSSLPEAGLFRFDETEEKEPLIEAAKSLQDGLKRSPNGYVSEAPRTPSDAQKNAQNPPSFSLNSLKKEKVVIGEVRGQEARAVMEDMETRHSTRMGRRSAKTVDAEKTTPRMQSADRLSSQSSDNPRPQGHLYFPSPEYNKAAMTGKHPSGQGYYNRYRQFVPLYPPRERFPLSETEVSEDMEPDGGTPKARDPDAGVFSVVKKIFKRH